MPHCPVSRTAAHADVLPIVISTRELHIYTTYPPANSLTVQVEKKKKKKKKKAEADDDEPVQKKAVHASPWIGGLPANASPKVSSILIYIYIRLSLYLCRLISSPHVVRGKEGVWLIRGI